MLMLHVSVLTPLIEAFRDLCFPVPIMGQFFTSCDFFHKEKNVWKPCTCCVIVLHLTCCQQYILLPRPRLCASPLRNQDELPPMMFTKTCVEHSGALSLQATSLKPHLCSGVRCVQQCNNAACSSTDTYSKLWLCQWKTVQAVSSALPALCLTNAWQCDSSCLSFMALAFVFNVNTSALNQVLSFGWRGFVVIQVVGLMWIC